MRSPRACVLSIGLLAVACGRPSNLPSLFGQDGGQPRTGTVSGRVVEYGSGAPVVGATVLLPGAAVVTDNTGAFLFPSVPDAGTAVISVSPIGYLRRAFPITLAPSRTDIVLDVIKDALPFSLAFYREFARNNLESGLQPLNPWTIAPSFYFNTTTVISGTRVPDDVINRLIEIFRRSVHELSAGKFEAAAFETGTVARDQQPGWVNVTFYSEMVNNSLGSASVGGNMGVMSLRYDPTLASTSFSNPYHCESVVVQVADHEITHTMGFWHTSNVFVDTFSGEGCPGQGRPAHVLHHAAIVYSRPPGNRDPDSDPDAAVRQTSPYGARRPTVSCFHGSW
jgi:hypothetical protein